MMLFSSLFKGDKVKFVWQILFKERKQRGKAKKLPLRSKKAGRYEKLLGFDMIHTIVTLDSVSLSSATTPHLSYFSKSKRLVQNDSWSKSWILGVNQPFKLSEQLSKKWHLQNLKKWIEVLRWKTTGSSQSNFLPAMNLLLRQMVKHALLMLF